MSKYKKEFLSKLQGLSHSRSQHRVFSDWLEVTAVSMHQLPYHSGNLQKDEAFERLEAIYMERIKPYTREELITFRAMMQIVLTVHHSSSGDFLGEIAGEADLLNARGGQFFTPYRICQLIAGVSLSDIRGGVEKKGVVIISDPAVGAGALIMASAEEIAKQGIDPCAHVQFDCTDVSRDAFNMAYIQLSALGLQAVVHHGNTITQEMWEHRPTMQLRLFQQWIEQRQREEKLRQLLRSLSSNEVVIQSESAELPLDRSPQSVASDGTLFDLSDFSSDVQKTAHKHRQPDIVLDRQISLF